MPERHPSLPHRGRKAAGIRRAGRVRLRPTRSARACSEAYGKAIDRSRVTGIEEISGHGITATVDGHSGRRRQRQADADSSASNTHDCHSVGHDHPHGHRRRLRRAHRHLRYRQAALRTRPLPDAQEVRRLARPSCSRATRKPRSRAGCRRAGRRRGPQRAAAAATRSAEVEELLGRKGTRRTMLAFVGDGINDAPVL